MPPANDALWLVSVRADAGADDQLDDLNTTLASSKPTGAAIVLGGAGKLGEAVAIDFPDFKTGTLSSLLTLSESLAKHDPLVTSILTKTVDTIRQLTSPPTSSSSTSSSSTTSSSTTRSSPLSAHLLTDDGRPYLESLFPSGEGSRKWEWNRAKYRTESKSLAEVVDGLVKEAQSIENAHRAKAGQYTVVKGQLTAALRKKIGNLSIRSLAEVVSADAFAGTSDSEYLETVLVAVPKNAVKEWETGYERLSQMVVPRSSAKLAADDEFVLYGVAIFRRVKDEFAQKCREHKFIVRDFTYNETEIEKHKVDLTLLEAQEKELWTDLLRLSRINFAELFQVLVHLKVVRAYVESVLRYGLPANYFVVVIKPEPKQATKLLSTLSAHFAALAPPSNKMRKTGKSGNADDEGLSGEYAGVLEGEYLDFVLFEVGRVEG